MRLSIIINSEINNERSLNRGGSRRNEELPQNLHKICKENCNKYSSRKLHGWRFPRTTDVVSRARARDPIDTPRHPGTSHGRRRRTSDLEQTRRVKPSLASSRRGVRGVNRTRFRGKPVLEIRRQPAAAAGNRYSGPVSPQRSSCLCRAFSATARKNKTIVNDNRRCDAHGIVGRLTRSFFRASWNSQPSSGGFK